MLERAFEAAPHEPRVERVVAVLDQHGPLREAEECPSRVLELRGADEHRSVDVVAPPRVRVDGGTAVDQGVEERERAIELEPLGADLENEEGGIARRLHVQRHELGVFELRVGTQLGRIDRDFLPRHQLRRSARLE